MSANVNFAQATLFEAYLNLQKIITANALIVHLMVGIISITSILILDKGKPRDRVSGAQPESSETRTYSLLEAERGAGMSQRTRRP